VVQEQELRLKLENEKFISEYNQITDKEGLPLDKWKTF
jgi:post-segregation antitoxin (ccd killing protein)